MTDDDLEHIYDVMDEEGFDYAFLFHSKFENIQDDEFHKLRKEFVAAARALQHYLCIDTEEIDAIHTEKPRNVC
jgi:hypothetical protein